MMERRTRRAFRFGALAAACLFLGIVFGAPASARPLRAILYLVSAPTVRDVFREDRPHLQSLLSESGVALLVSGPARYDPDTTLRAGRYLPGAASVPPDWPAGVLVIADRDADGALGDALLGAAQARFPNATVMALHAGPWRPAGARIAYGLSIPSWISITGRHGRLYSDTVRRAGVVSSLDVLPTLQKITTDAYDPALPGRPIWGDGLTRNTMRKGLPYQLEAAVRLQDALAAIAVSVQPALAGLGVAGALLLVAAAWLSRRGSPPESAIRRAVQALLMLALLTPAGMIHGAGSLPANAGAFAVRSAGATLGLCIFVRLAARLLRGGRTDETAASLQMACGALAVAIALAAWRHDVGLVMSPFSSQYLYGVRFYGIGNELGALFLAATTLFGFVTLDRARVAKVGEGTALAFGALFVWAALVLGRPTAGANFGMMIACLVTGSVAFILLCRTVGARVVGWVYPVVVAPLVFGYVLWLHVGRKTHVGRLAASHGSGGGLSAVLSNKAAIFLRVVSSPWVWLALAFGAAVAALMRGNLAEVPRLLASRWPWSSRAFVALLWGGLAGAVLNDSGLIVPGLMLGACAVALAVLALEARPGEPTLPVAG